MNTNEIKKEVNIAKPVLV